MCVIVSLEGHGGERGRHARLPDHRLHAHPAGVYGKRDARDTKGRPHAVSPHEEDGELLGQWLRPAEAGKTARHQGGSRTAKNRVTARRRRADTHQRCRGQHARHPGTATRRGNPGGIYREPGRAILRHFPRRGDKLCRQETLLGLRGRRADHAGLHDRLQQQLGLLQVQPQEVGVQLLLQSQLARLRPAAV